MMRAPIAAMLLCSLVTMGASRAFAGPALLFEPATGKVLYAEDADHLWYPASLTKIMTAYLTFAALKSGRLTLDQKIVVSEKAHIQAPSKVGLPVGAEMTVDLALRALIVKSANDTAIMLAEAIGGTEEDFVKQMNETAQRLGMSKKKFVNANGLPTPDQVTTARDLARLGRAVLRDFPEQSALWALPEVQIGKLKLRSHNGLLRTFEGADGLKTGFICDSGFNVVASATRDGRKLMAVVLGDPSGRERNIRAASLLDHGFQTWDWKQLFNGATIETLPVAADAKDVHSVRQTIVSWNCGNAKRRVPVKKKAVSTAASAKAKDGKKPAPKAAAAPRNAAATGKPATRSGKATE
jgi:D-alanyl-D-alanine carboxypeptidase